MLGLSLVSAVKFKHTLISENRSHVSSNGNQLSNIFIINAVYRALNG